MSILIRNMEMPMNCAECPIADIGAEFYYCEKIELKAETRPCDCPLVEVPTPHGRLIDADALHDAMYHRAFETDGDTMWQSGCWVRYRAIEQVHESQPIIIKAEGETDGR